MSGTPPASKVEGRRRAVRDHIAKYQRYSDKQDKEFALKTIQRVQRQIADLKRRKPKIRGSDEDSWRPWFGTATARNWRLQMKFVCPLLLFYVVGWFTAIMVIRVRA